MQKNHSLLFVYFLTSVSCSLLAQSPTQATFSAGYNPDTISDILSTSECITISDMTAAGTRNPNRQIATFSDGNAAGLSIDKGLLLTTGSAANSFSQTGDDVYNNGTTNDPDIDAVDTDDIGTNDEAIVTFNFTTGPTTTAIRVPFQFASVEYDGFVCSQYNDIFRFFISGPGITGTQNIALVPGTNTPIQVNTINNGSCSGGGPPPAGSGSDLTNSALYIDNSGGAIFSVYDGFTTLIEAQMTGLLPNTTYQFKLAIADFSDQRYDSGVFVGPIEVDDCNPCAAERPTF